MKNSFDEYLENVVDLVENFEFEDALSKINNADRNKTKNSNQSGSLAALKWYCEYCLDDAIEADSVSVEIAEEIRTDFLDGFGTQLANVNALHLAEPVFEHLVELAPNDAMSWHKFGLTLLKQNDIERAIVAFQKAVSIDYEFASSHFLLGESLSRIDEPEDAAAAYAKCAELVPNDLDALILCGIEYSRAGDSEKAIAMFESAIVVDTSSASAYYNLAVIAFSTENIDLLRNIRDRFSKFVKDAELDARTNLIDADVYELSGNIECAWDSHNTAFLRSIEFEQWETMEASAGIALAFCQRNNTIEHFESLIDYLFEYRIFPENILQYLRETTGRKLDKGKYFKVTIEGTIAGEQLGSTEGENDLLGYFWSAEVIAESSHQAGSLALEFDRRCGRRPQSVSSVEPIEGNDINFQINEGIYWCQQEINIFPLI